uniref:ATP synthase F0 subunit 8 n=1 Tax=Denticeps clupeoides TaxID=299321 RepID=A0AAY4DJS5_9TELE
MELPFTRLELFFIFLAFTVFSIFSIASLYKCSQSVTGTFTKLLMDKFDLRFVAQFMLPFCTFHPWFLS